MLHFATTPFGIAATTLATTHWHDSATRPAIRYFDEMASLVSVSAVIYGMIAVAAELGGRAVFWALAQRQKEKDAAVRVRRELRAKARAEGHMEGRLEGRLEGRMEGHAEGRVEGQRDLIYDMWNAAESDADRARVRRIAESRGIPLPPQ